MGITKATGNRPLSLQIREVSKYYGSNLVLDAVSLDIEEGEFVALLGTIRFRQDYPSCAQSPDCNLPTEAPSPMTGRTSPGLTRALRRFGMVFQNYALFEHMSVAENVAFGLKMRDRSRRPSSSEIKRRVCRLAGYGANRTTGWALSQPAIWRTTPAGRAHPRSCN